MATRLIANTGRTTGMATGLSAIFFQNRAALLRFLRARGAGEDAEDLLQDMWMKLEAKDLGPVADPLPYLYRMANNLMLDRYRSATRRERREQDWAEGAGGVMTDPNDDLAVDERMILNQRLEQARRLIRDGHGLAEAALQAGFADQSHMTRLFGRQFGYTPGAWQLAAGRHRPLQ